jgi:membrane peptidoglycan carboxypeptidase
MDPDTGKQKKLYGSMNLKRINGGGPPGQVWASYTAAALHNVPVKDFDLAVAKELPPLPPVTDEPSATDEPTSEPPTSEPPASSEPPSSSPTSDPPTDSPPPTSEPPTSEPTTEPPTFDPLGGLTGGGGATPNGPGGGGSG